MMFGKINKFVPPAFRFNTGWQAIGAQVRPKDVRTQEQILATIDTLLSKAPDLQKFRSDIKKADAKYLGLISDVLELSNIHEMTSVPINMNKVVNKDGKSLIQALLEVLPKASKENPAALDFAQEVINNTDIITSKYFLAELPSVINNLKLSEFFKATKPMVKDIAESTLNGGPTMDYSKQKLFMDFVKTLVNPHNNLENLRLLPKLSRTLDEVSGKQHEICIDKFITSNKKPVSSIEDNIQTLKSVLPTAEEQGRPIDVVDFVLNNTNLK